MSGKKVWAEEKLAAYSSATVARHAGWFEVRDTSELFTQTTTAAGTLGSHYTKPKSSEEYDKMRPELSSGVKWHDWRMAGRDFGIFAGFPVAKSVIEFVSFCESQKHVKVTGKTWLFKAKFGQSVLISGWYLNISIWILQLAEVVFFTISIHFVIYRIC